MFGLFKKLKQKGVLSMNARNADYVLRYNARKYYPLVDDKLKTKSLALDNGIPTPELLTVLEAESDLKAFKKIVSNWQDFVIKPAHGAGGDGILVITAQQHGKFRKSSGSLMTFDEIAHHVSNILSGMYSLGGCRDKALVEYRVKPDSCFEDISYQGVPDVRIIVFQGYPVMGMLRLPTQHSNGKANLHQGAIGVGIDLASGKTLSGVMGNEIIQSHPDTSQSISHFQVPHWEQCLKMASRCFELTQLGYLGVDIILDKHQGPLMLELNARPGLNIQIANQEGILHRLKKVELFTMNVQSLNFEERIHFCQKNFAAPTSHKLSSLAKTAALNHLNLKDIDAVS